VSGAAANVPARRAERLALLAAAAGYFCLLGGYYMLRPIREALAIQASVRNNFELFAAVLAVTCVLLPIYWQLVRRTPRGRLLWLVAIPFVAVFLCLYAGLTVDPANRMLAFAYFVALSSANYFLVSVFWSAMSDVWRPRFAKRFYGYVAAGGSAGALVGPFIVTSTVRDVGTAPLIVVACVFILATAALASLARRLLRRCPGGEAVPDGAIPVGGRAWDDLRRLARTPYLLGIVGLIITGQIIGAFMYNEQQKFAIATYSAVAERTAFFANMEIAVSLLALFFQAVVVTWLTRRGSVAWSLSAMPVVVGLSFIALALFPVAAVFLATQVLRRAADYGLGKPPREMLFTVLNAESKFKSKSLIDTAFTRAADALGQWLYLFVGSLGLVGLAWLGAALCVVLLWATRTLGRAFETRRREDAPARAS
jgi:ATP:ADP antiporter, AAA family